MKKTPKEKGKRRKQKKISHFVLRDTPEAVRQRIRQFNVKVALRSRRTIKSYSGKIDGAPTPDSFQDKHLQGVVSRLEQETVKQKYVTGGDRYRFSLGAPRGVWSVYRSRLKEYTVYPSLFKFLEELKGENVLNIGDSTGHPMEELLILQPGIKAAVAFDLTLAPPDMRAGYKTRRGWYTAPDGKYKLWTQSEKKKNEKLAFREGDMREMPFRRDRFGLVLSNHTLRYSSDIFSVIGRTLETLKPGGLFLVPEKDITDHIENSLFVDVPLGEGKITQHGTRRGYLKPTAEKVLGEHFSTRLGDGRGFNFLVRLLESSGIECEVYHSPYGEREERTLVIKNPPTKGEKEKALKELAKRKPELACFRDPKKVGVDEGILPVYYVPGSARELIAKSPSFPSNVPVLPVEEPKLERLFYRRAPRVKGCRTVEFIRDGKEATGLRVTTLLDDRGKKRRKMVAELMRKTADNPPRLHVKVVEGDKVLFTEVFEPVRESPGSIEGTFRLVGGDSYERGLEHGLFTITTLRDMIEPREREHKLYELIAEEKGGKVGNDMYRREALLVLDWLQRAEWISEKNFPRSLPNNAPASWGKMKKGYIIPDGELRRIERRVNRVLKKLGK
jgi:hypothetical protein